MKSEQGNITSFALLVILLSVSFISITLLSKFHKIKNHKSVLENYLCLKESDGLVKSHYQFMTRTNSLITTSNAGQVVGAGLNPALIIAAKRIKRLTQVAQDIRHISFLKKIASLFKDKCIFTPSVAKTHFETKSVIKLIRTISGLAKKREREWGYSSIGKKNVLKVIHKKEKSISQDIIF